MVKDEQNPPNKRARKVVVADADDELERVIDTAWEHYRNYVDDEDGGETDELLELIEVLKGVPINPACSFTTGTVPTTRALLLPVLISVASTVLADDAISELVQQQQQQSVEVDDHAAAVAKMAVCTQNIRGHLQRALSAFPENAAAIHVAANYVRLATTNGGGTSMVPPAQLAAIYAHAALCASTVRTAAIALLDHEQVPSRCKEMIELLLLNQVAEVELGDYEEDEEDEEAEWGASGVEGTARFMAAMLSSLAGNHDAACQQLKPFGITHRLHPKLWERGLVTEMATTTATEQHSSDPVSYRSHTGVLPEQLYSRLCTVFHPDACYWKESDYAERGYYSYFMDLPAVDQPVSNLIEDVVCNHLLPLAQQQQLKQGGGESSSDDAIVGYEWWVHTRPVTANLGHNLHFDTDECLLAEDGSITHPILSSVLYLTGGNLGSGATVIFDQSPDSQQNAERAWCSLPVDNSFMVFPGNLLHGVLPCIGTTSSGNVAAAVHANSVDIASSDNQKMMATLTSLLSNEEKPASTPSSADATPHRLTFMVGFWTRRVPDRMKEQQLYGPCGPLPSADEAGWVKAIQENYCVSNNSKDERTNARREAIVPMPVPSVAPAWEELVVAEDNAHGEAQLQIPRASDHRFFVINAPNCFRDSLFEKDGFDDLGGEEENEEEEEADDDEEEKDEEEAEN